ncbi:MAG: hypothetical protein JWO76_75, partial [Nocardioides sp.]|nr:hypothetical protein [Nocardioides sp.]
MTTWGDVTQWRGDAVGAAGEQLRADLHKLERAADEVRGRVVPGSWLGLAQVFARARQRRLVATMDTHVSGAQAFVAAIFAAEGKVAGIHEVAVEIEHDARAQQFEIGPDGTVTDVAGSRNFESPRAADAYVHGRVVERDALVARVTGVLDAAYEVDSALEGARPDDAFNDAGPLGVVDPQVEREWSTMS